MRDSDGEVMACNFSLGEGLFTSVDSSRARFTTFYSPCFKLCTPKSLNMPAYAYCLYDAYSACAYTYLVGLDN